MKKVAMVIVCATATFVTYSYQLSKRLISYDVKLGYCFSTHFDNFVFCDLIPFDVFGLVGMNFKKDKCPSSVVT